MFFVCVRFIAGPRRGMVLALDPLSAEQHIRGGLAKRITLEEYRDIQAS